MSEELKRIYKYVDGHKRVRKENPSGDEIIDTSEENIIETEKNEVTETKRYVTSVVIVLCIGLAILDRGLIPPDLGHTLFEKWFGKWFGMSLEVFLQSFQYTVENLEAKRLWVPLSSSLIHEWSPEQYKGFHGIRLLFNLFWFWELGGRIESRVGNTEWLLLISLVAMVTSGCQYLTYPLPAVGLSGVMYGCFGYMWVQRRRVSEYEGILSSFNVFILTGWLFLSIVLSLTGLYEEVTNIAYMTGLLFGVMTGYMFSRKWLEKIFVYLVIFFMIAIALVPLLYSSWEINTFVRQLEQRWNKCCSQAWN